MKRVNARTRWFWHLLLAGVCLIALWVPLYNRAGPTLAGIPFFYWFQFVWIGVSAGVTALAYKAGV
ncbi:MAG TPA: DUF3311 domain-containing protein [Rhodanobacteraceae bacterium]|nr:DUF3311 domain-containing protein [Rhodanobacteraceae bacterium]